jgi:DNA-binding transcriptional LysR family regulator
MPSFRHYQYALALAEFGSFKRAALEVHVSQPALSKGIAALEEELGYELFDRTAHPLRPTQAGCLLIEEAKRCTMGYRRLQESLLQLKGDVQGCVRICFGPYAGHTLAVPFIQAFQSRFPGFELHVETRAWNGLARRLRTLEIDIAVGDISDPTLHDEFEIHPLPGEAAALICSADHPLADKTPVELSTVFAYPLALCSAPSWATRFMRQHMQEYDKRESPALIRVNDFRMIRDLVLAGSCSTIGFATGFQADIISGNVVVIPLKDFPKTQPGILLCKNEHHPGELSECVEILKGLNETQL